MGTHLRIIHILTTTRIISDGSMAGKRLERKTVLVTRDKFDKYAELMEEITDVIARRLGHLYQRTLRIRTSGIILGGWNTLGLLRV